MDKRELLALLAARGIDPMNVPGGIPSITQLDVAGMMAKLSPCESALLRAKYCGDPIHEAWAHWFKMLMAEGWKVKKSGAIDALSRITIAEHVSHNRCTMCNGTKGWMAASKYQACPVCEGSGVVYLTRREVAGRMGFDEGLKEPWKSRLDWWRRRLVVWEDVAIGKMR